MNKNAHRNAEDSRSRRAMVGGKLSFSASEAYKLLRTNVMFSLAEDEDGSRIFGIDAARVRRPEERRVGKECRSRGSPYH